MTNLNLSVTPTTRKVKRENRSARGTTRVSPDVPPECAVCGYALRLSGKCSNYECTSRLRSKGPSVFSFDDLVKDAPPPLYHGRAWGEWTLDVERLCLVFRGTPSRRGDGSGVTVGVKPYTAFIGLYEIDLERICDSASLLDWIFQIQGKIWATARVIKDLLNAFDSIIHPQRNLCSGALCGFGRSSKTIANPTAFLKNRIATVGKPDGPLKDAA